MNIYKNEVTFAKGTKPYPIKQAQRNVRDIYMTMVKLQLPRDKDLASKMYQSAQLASLPPEQIPPLFQCAIQSAARAYASAGDSLAKIRTMFAMDLRLPIHQLELIELELLDKDKAALRALEASELVFKARETSGVMYVPKTAFVPK